MTEPEKKETLLEQAIRVRAERLSKDVLSHYKPGATQQRCLLSPKMIRMLQGGNRSGKTSHMCVEFAMMALRRHPTRTTDKRVTLILWTNSREQIRDTLYKKLRVGSEMAGPLEQQPMIPDHEVIKDHMVSGAGKPVCREIELKNGNRILFAISGVERSWQMLEGKGYVAAIGIDEQAGTQKLVDECMARLMELNNPTNVAEFGGAWFMWAASETKINDAWDNLKAICLDPEKNQDAEYFHIPPEENFAVTMEARERVAQFMSPAARKIRITGDGSARDEVQIYRKQWSDQRHMLPKDHIPSDKANLWVGYDPGVDHNTGIIIACIEPENPMRLIIVKVWNAKGGTLDTDVMQLAEWFAGRKMAGFVYDTVLKNRNRGGGPTLLEQMKDKLSAANLSPSGYWQSRKNVWDGIQLTRSMLDPDPQNRSASPLIVVNPSDESGGKLLRWQFLKYSGKESTQFTGGGGVNKLDDDALDALRYVSMARPSWNRDHMCGYGEKGYVFPAQEVNDLTVEVLTPEQAHMKRLMDMSKLAASLRRTRRRH